MSKSFTAEKSNRLDKILNNLIPKSRNQIQQWISQGRVRIDGEIVTKKSYKIEAGQKLVVDEPESLDEHEGIVPEEGPIDVIHKDEHILVLNKQSGIVVHPTESRPKGTLANRLVHEFPGLASVGEPHRAGLAHRLDKGTSGVLVVARDNQSLRYIQDQFRERSVKKKYRCILTGVLKDESLRIEVPIGYNSRNRVLREATPDGQYAETTLQREGYGEDTTAVWCIPLTGRTHQIRVHAKYVGHPVLGDDKYGGRSASRLMLHSEFIEFQHPDSGKRVSYESTPDEEVFQCWENACVNSQ